jgi:hypothetical protein
MEGTCNLFYHQCVIADESTLAYYNRLFIQCLVSANVPPFILSALVDETDVRNTQDADRTSLLTEYIMNKYTEELCGSVNHLDFNYFDSWYLFQVCRGMVPNLFIFCEISGFFGFFGVNGF